MGTGQYQLVWRAAEKAYEAYVLGLCIRAVRELGVVPVLRGIESDPTPFVFRGAPGRIHSRTRNYGYVEFSLNDHEFEIHACVEFRGTSGVTHELDVSLVQAEEARRCRHTPADPKPASLIAGWECKFYGSTLDKALGRAFVGLLDDMSTQMRLAGLCSNADSSALKRFFVPQRRPFPHFGLSPLSPRNETIFVSSIVRELKKLTGA